uniref:Caspase 3 n=1 Tax=Homo sapiens TaxID=9606 RepID=A0A8V8TPU5_HUMAN
MENTENSVDSKSIKNLEPNDISVWYRCRCSKPQGNIQKLEI